MAADVTLTDLLVKQPVGPDRSEADDVRLDRIRADLPAVRRGGYFNAGYTGPLCAAASAAVADTVRREYEVGRMGPGPRDEARRTQADARDLVAELLTCGRDEVALTQHTTEGVNAVVLGLPWRAGDNAVTTRIEHKGVLLPLGVLRDRKDVDVRAVTWDPFDSVNVLVQQVLDSIDARTRLVALSHVSYVTGGLIPLQAVIEKAHRHGALVLVDGAQTAGVLPIDVHALGVDAYPISGQKWLCGPEGTGAMYVSSAALERILPTVVGWASVASWQLDGSFEPYPDATRYEVGTRSRPLVAGFAAALRWSRDQVGRQWAAERTATLGARLREGLLSRTPAVPLTHGDHVGLISFRLPLPPAEVVRRLAEREITVRSIDGYDCVRACVGYFHTEDEVDDLVEQIAVVAR
ncbi:MAG TPA: aminotransferase class V-fold PLP-dependent enzyme [Kineosporiaceae bacterium]|nr:aminotransferase class V-fold PLP-dependent enzyme [Kineosporiaceae bacterium]